MNKPASCKPHGCYSTKTHSTDWVVAALVTIVDAWLHGDDSIKRLYPVKKKEGILHEFTAKSVCCHGNESFDVMEIVSDPSFRWGEVHDTMEYKEFSLKILVNEDKEELKIKLNIRDKFNQRCDMRWVTVGPFFNSKDIMALLKEERF